MDDPRIVSRQPVAIGRDFTVEIVSHNIWPVTANALVLHLPQPRPVLCAYQGYRRVTAVCNIYHPPALWNAVDNHSMTYRTYSSRVHRGLLAALLPGERVAVVSTGVDMKDHVMVEETYDRLWVQAWVTAGVKNNAIRVGRDKAAGIETRGLYRSLGTINIIVLTSASLGQAAMASSFITITEAKTAALQDLDIRSSYHPEWPATGTSTDQIAVVSGTGERCFYVSGQVKLGELMARAVTRGVIQAIIKSGSHNIASEQRD